VSQTLCKIVVFPAFALPIMSTLNLTFGSRGRSSCVAIDQKVVRRNTGEGDDQMQTLDSAETLYISIVFIIIITII
jgi:hypothetical protein